MKKRCPICGYVMYADKRFKDHMLIAHNIDYTNLGNELADILVKMDACRTTLESLGVKC
ncbi:unnamed protein product [marine sediment metagenome]|uniref:Uncharacterized protein n=1 Tax=marine sediment metagenome TaxID=412755 RepID=X1CYS7_9ZZZZ